MEVPHPEQNLAPCGLAAWQDGQATVGGAIDVPQFAQNLAPGALGVLQDEQAAP